MVSTILPRLAKSWRQELVNEHVKNYEIIKYIYILFREVIKILNREIFVLEVERMAGFFIKYGEKEHLQQIVDGKLRFTPSQTYIKIEEKQHNKGQGDLLEGKMKIKIEGARMYHPETNEYLGTLPKSTVVISIQDVSNMPIFVYLIMARNQ